jgi:hypothetical protein
VPRKPPLLARRTTIGRVSGKTKAKRPKGVKTQATDLFPKFCKLEGLPVPVTELRFDPVRKWRFDYAFLEQRVALEVDGGVWTGGRHTRGAGWLRDTEKLNAAAAMGWRLLRCTPQQLFSPEIIETIRKALA